MRMLPAKIHPMSCDRKLSPVDLVDVGQPRPRPTPRAPFCSSTYASIHATCTDDCPLKGNGCYVDAGFTRFANDLLDQAVMGKTPAKVAAIEAELLDATFPQQLRSTRRGMVVSGGVPQDGARGGRDLRLHVGGDCADEESAKILAGAARRWRARGGGSVWTYTHSWRRIPREAWGEINVLASVERPEQIAEARARGYAPALVVEQHADARAYQLAGVRMIPCPAETRGRTCVDCRLCVDQDLHQLGAGIAFALHGQNASAAARALTPRTGESPLTPLRVHPRSGEEDRDAQLLPRTA